MCMNGKKDELPWYLRDTAFFIISLIFVPLSLIILMVNSGKIDREILSDRAFIAFLFSLIFVMNFLPRNGFTLTISMLFYLFTGFLLLMKFSKGD